MRSLHRLLVRAATLACGLLLVQGCAPNDRPAVTTTSRDSAGITIVENTLPDRRALTRWRLTEPPELEIGVLEGDAAHQFSNVIGATKLSDGRIVVGDGQSKEVRYFDATGRHEATAGGPGEGPGEFRFLYSIDRMPGDTIVAGGWPIGWANIFDPQGSYVTNIRLGPYFPSLLGHFLTDGSFLMDVYGRRGYGNELEFWAANGEEPNFRARGHITRLIPIDGDTTRIDTLRTIDGEEWFKIGRARQGLTIHTAPFPRNTHVAWSADRLYVGESTTSEIEVRQLDGTLETLVRWEGVTVPVTGQDQNDYREELIGGLNARQRNRMADYERWLAEVPYPETKPAFKALAVDPSDRLWVRLWPPAAAQREEWMIFSPAGELAFTVDVPKGLEFLEVGDDYVIALYKDDLDLEYVRVYRIER